MSGSKAPQRTEQKPNQPFHLTPEAGAFYLLPFLALNFTFAKPSLLLVQVTFPFVDGRDKLSQKWSF